MAKKYFDNASEHCQSLGGEVSRIFGLSHIQHVQESYVLGTVILQTHKKYFYANFNKLQNMK